MKKVGITGNIYVRVVHVYLGNPSKGSFMVYEDGDNSSLETFEALEWSSCSIPVPFPVFDEGFSGS